MAKPLNKFYRLNIKRIDFPFHMRNSSTTPVPYFYVPSSIVFQAAEKGWEIVNEKI